MTKQFLKRLPLFAKLSDEDLDRLYNMGEQVSVRAGELLIEEGTLGDAVYVILEGQFEVTKQSGDEAVVIAGCEAGEVIGEISLLGRAPRSASVRALRHSRLLKISEETFDHLLETSPSAALAVLQTVMGRLRNTEAMLMQHEKMAALGNLSAGLAHELNNPASAVVRSADQLTEALAIWQHALLSLQASGQASRVEALLEGLRAQLEQGVSMTRTLDTLARADLESDLQEWLEERGVAEPWSLAPQLVSAGWDIPALETLSEGLDPSLLPDILTWLGGASLVYGLLGEIRTGAGQVSDIVKAVKTYSFLDRGPVQRDSIPDSLNDTLTILRHKLKQGVRVLLDFAPGLPSVEAYGSELNQVWTNIIDNAIQAMDGQGELLLKAYASDSQVVVEITDSGPGIPEKVQPRIFEPFFTTKGPGLGTGLGLHIAQNIVTLKHNGRITVSSRPGKTTFSVAIPVRLERKAA